jgi:hypothetical protein
MNGPAQFEGLIQKILLHPSYGPAMAQAVAGDNPLVLNYHNHLEGGHYCLSICARTQSPVKLLETEQGTLEELVHIEGFGKNESDGIPLTRAFSEALRKHYGIERPLDYLLNGEHQPSPTDGGENPGG